MGLVLDMPLRHFLDPLVEDLFLLSEPGGAQVADLPLPSATPAPSPCVEVGVVLVLALVVHTPMVWGGG